MSAKVLSLIHSDATKHKRKHVQDIYDYAHQRIEEDQPEQLMVIIPHRDKLPEMMMAGMSEIEMLGTLEFIKGLVMTSQTQSLDDYEAPNDDAPEED